MHSMAWSDKQSKQLNQQQSIHTDDKNTYVDTGRHLKQAQRQIDNTDAIYPDKSDLYTQTFMQAD